jgi:hypothetical protein
MTLKAVVCRFKPECNQYQPLGFKCNNAVSSRRCELFRTFLMLAEAEASS